VVLGWANKTGNSMMDDGFFPWALIRVGKIICVTQG
jgi:hypothetical protein